MFSLFFQNTVSERWGVIFCGSNGWGNYRHTADSYYQYSVLRRNIADDHLIVMCYDDIVNCASNKYPGQIFRTLDHRNVYPGAENVDYTGDAVTAENYFKVLTGDSSAGPALQSTSSDDVFIFFDDHGGSGILCTPVGDDIKAADMASTLQTMHDKGLYRYCFYPITACYSGSVAKYCADIPNLLIWTASNDHESSYADLWDDDLGCYLTSEFSHILSTYMEEHSSETLGDAFPNIVDGVKESHVCTYGDTALNTLTFEVFVGPQAGPYSPRKKATTTIRASEINTKLSYLNLIRNRVDGEERKEVEKAIAVEEYYRNRLSELVENLRRMFCANVNVDMTKDPEQINFARYGKVIDHLKAKLGYVPENYYELSFFFSNLCSFVEAEPIIKAIDRLL